MRVALVTTPVARHSKTPTLAEWHEPRSSALMMSSLASAEYPSRCARLGLLIASRTSRHFGILRPRRTGDLRLVVLHSCSQDFIAHGKNAHGQQSCIASPVHGH